MQNEQTGRIEQLTKIETAYSNKYEKDKKTLAEIKEIIKESSNTVNPLHPDLVKLDGSPIPKSAIIFKIGELIEIKGYTYRLAYMNENTLVSEPVRPEDALQKRRNGKGETDVPK